MKQPHLRVDKGEVNDYCLIVGRPERVDVIMKLLDKAEKVSVNRGYIIANGEYKGVPVTICNTGIGGPSAAVAIEELINVGAKTIIRAGSCGMLQKGMKTGDLVISTGVCKEEDSTLAYERYEFAAVPNYDVLNALINSARESGKKFHYGLTMCTDAFYSKSHREQMMEWSKRGVLASDMESSMLFILARLRGVRAGFIAYGGLNIAEKQTHKDIIKQEKERRRGEKNAIMVALNAIKKLEEVG
ncbi:nucleoside phosphorylase|nr:nucleoside phosphorylase [archaeon]